MIRVLVFGAFLALVSWLLHRRLTRSVGLGPQGSRTVAVALAAAWALALVGLGSGEVFDPSWARGPAFAGWVWLAVMLYLALGLLLVAAVSGASRLLPRHRGGESSGPGLTRRRLLRGATAAVVLGSFAAAAYGVGEAATPRVRHVRVPLRRLPAEFAGTRIALVTDLHVGPARGVGFTRKVVAAVAAQRPDLILLGGDLVDGTVAMVGADLAPLAELTAPLGVYGVSGNHEFYAGDGGRWLDLWDRLGIHTLR
ncbi:metallophosphoesterase, partial [Rhodococcus sp. NPDC058514]